jgi:hypothetical protein
LLLLHQQEKLLHKLLTGTITSLYSSSSYITKAQAQSVDKLIDDIDCDNIDLNGNDINNDALPEP